MGTRFRSSIFTVTTAGLLATIVLGLAFPAGSHAFNLESALATPPLAMAPAADEEPQGRFLPALVKGKTALGLLAKPVLGAVSLSSSVGAAVARASVEAASDSRPFELSGAWSLEEAGEPEPTNYASLVPSHIPPELRLLPVVESLSSSQSSAIADFALGYTLAALRSGPAEEEPIVRLQVLLGGSRPSELQRLRPRAKAGDMAVGDGWKPVVGGRFFLDLARDWSLALRGDARGFRPTGSSSDMSWNVVGSVGRKVGDLLEVRLGYRVSRIDMGATRTPVDLKRVVQGPQLGIGFDF